MSKHVTSEMANKLYLAKFQYQIIFKKLSSPKTKLASN